MAYESIRQVFEEGMPARFNKSATNNDSANYLFRIRTSGSMEEWTLQVQNGDLTIVQGNPGMPHCVLTLTDEDFLDMANGKESIQMLYMIGKLVVEGDLPYAVKLARYFPSDKDKK